MNRWLQGCLRSQEVQCRQGLSPGRQSSGRSHLWHLQWGQLRIRQILRCRLRIIRRWKIETMEMMNIVNEIFDEINFFLHWSLWLCFLIGLNTHLFKNRLFTDFQSAIFKEISSKILFFVKSLIRNVHQYQIKLINPFYFIVYTNIRISFGVITRKLIF